MSSAEQITATRTELEAAFKAWELGVNPSTDYSPDEWASFTPDQRASLSADYLIKLLKG